MNTHVEHTFLFFDREVPLLVQGVSLMTHLYAKRVVILGQNVSFRSNWIN